MPVLRACFALIIALAVASCDAPTASERRVWRFAIEESSGSVQDAYAQRFRQLVEERTGGEIEVIVYPYGALGTSDHLTEQLHNGTLQFAMSSPGHLGKLIPEVQAFLLHFVLSEDERVTAEALRDPELVAFMNDLYAEKGLAYLTAFGEGWMAWTTQQEVRRPEDLEGVRFRVMTSPLLLASYEAYGANPTPLPFSEVYSGLQLHMIDAQVNPVFAIEEMSFHEVTEVLTFPQHAEFITTVASNPAFLEGLPPERRQMIADIVDELQTEIFDVQQRYNRERLDRIREQRPDMRIVHLTDAERAPFRERAATVQDQYIDMAGPRGTELLAIMERAVARAEARLPEE